MYERSIRVLDSCDSFENDVMELSQRISNELCIDPDLILRVLLWELELRDRQYLCPGNYLDWMAEDISAETGIDESVVYDILETEQKYSCD